MIHLFLKQSSNNTSKKVKLTDLVALILTFKPVQNKKGGGTRSASLLPGCAETLHPSIQLALTQDAGFQRGCIFLKSVLVQFPAGNVDGLVVGVIIVVVDDEDLVDGAGPEHPAVVE